MNHLGNILSFCLMKYLGLRKPIHYCIVRESHHIKTHSNNKLIIIKIMASYAQESMEVIHIFIIR